MNRIDRVRRELERAALEFHVALANNSSTQLLPAHNALCAAASDYGAAVIAARLPDTPPETKR